MSVKALLKQYAIESGEMEDPDFIDEDAHDEDEGYGYTADAKFGEMIRSVNLIESLESLSAYYEAKPVTVDSMESYHLAVGNLLHVSGMQLPASVIAASFEAADEEKKSIGSKAKAFIAKIIEWIRQKMASLKDWFKRRSAFFGKKAEQIKEKTVVAKEKIDELQKEGIHDVPTTAPAAAETPKEEPVKEEPTKPAPAPKKPIPAAAKEEPKPAAAVAAKQVPAKSSKVTTALILPAYMLSNGRLNSGNIAKILDKLMTLSSHDDLFREAMASSNDGTEVFEQFWNTNFAGLVKDSGTAHLAAKGANLGVVKELLVHTDKVCDVVSARGRHVGSTHLDKVAAANGIPETDSGLDDAEVKKRQDSVTKLLRVANKSGWLEDKTMKLLNDIDAGLLKIVAAGKK